MAGVNGTKFPAIRDHLQRNITQAYNGLDTSFDSYPANDAKDPDAYKAAIDGQVALGQINQQRVEVFKSTDHGRSWQYLSDCTRTSGLPDTIGHGIWEPWFLLAPDNTLACFISDERPANSPTNNQVIGHYTSTDGGRTWSGTLTRDVAFPADDLPLSYGGAALRPWPGGR